jgi:hypothetical protein
MLEGGAALALLFGGIPVVGYLAWSILSPVPSDVWWWVLALAVPGCIIGALAGLTRDD